jgi:hypothetical protein
MSSGGTLYVGVDVHDGESQVAVYKSMVNCCWREVYVRGFCQSLSLLFRVKSM